jgi:CRP-like cAMP-binding protein
VHRPELTERILHIRMMPILVGLPPRDIAALASMVRTRVFQRGEVILAEDEPPRSMYVVRTGVVTMRRRGKVIGTVRGPGGVGFISMLARTAGGTEAVADTRIDAYVIRAESMEEIFEDNFPILLRTMRFVAERLLGEMKDQEPPKYVPPQLPFDHLIGDEELGIVERIFLLRRARAFTAANVNSLATLARRMEEVRVPAGTVLWKPGDRAAEAYFVVKGMARVTWNDGARVQMVGPGYTLGGSEAIIGRPRWNELRTDEPLVALRGQHGALIDLFEDDHDLALRFLSMLATYLMALQDKKAEAGIASVGSGPYQVEPESPAATARPSVGRPGR